MSYERPKLNLAVAHDMDIVVFDTLNYSDWQWDVARRSDPVPIGSASFEHS